MRTLLLATLAATACATDRCKQGTVFLAYTLTNGAEAADTIDVTLSISGGSPRTMTVTRQTHSSSGSIEVDFAGAYPSSQSLAITLTARLGTQPLASSSQTTAAAAGCTTLAFPLDGAHTDLRSAELADLAPPPDLATVDLADLAHGYHWVAVPSGYTGTQPIFISVSGTSASNVYVVGVFLTSTASASVTHFDGTSFTPQTISSDIFPERVSVPTASAAFTAGTSLSGGDAVFQGSGGAWSRLVLPASVTTTIWSVWTPPGDATKIVIAGASGLVSSSANGGATWTAPQTTNTTKTLYGVWGASATELYAVGASATILYTVNGGANWQAQTPPAALTANLHAVYGLSATEIYAVGDGGTIIHSAGIGQWDLQSSGFASTNLHDVWGVGGDLYVVGDNGLILHSTNRGAAWVPEASTTSLQLSGVWGSSGVDAYAVGGNIGGFGAPGGSVILHRQ